MKLKHRIYPIATQEVDTINEEINLENEKDVRVVIDDQITEVLLTDIFRKVYYDKGDLEGFSLLFKAENSNEEIIQDGNILMGGKKIHLYIPEKDKHVFFTKVVVPNTIASSVSVGSNYIIGVSKLLGILEKAHEVFAGELSQEELQAIIKEQEIEKLKREELEKAKEQQPEAATSESTENPEDTEQKVSEEIPAVQLAETEMKPSEENVFSDSSMQETLEAQPQTAEVSSEPVNTDLPKIEDPILQSNVSQKPTTLVTSPSKVQESVLSPAGIPAPLPNDIPVLEIQVPTQSEEKVEVIQQEEKSQEEKPIKVEVLTEEEQEGEPEAKRWWSKAQKYLKERFLNEKGFNMKYLDYSYEDIPFKKKWLRWSNHLSDSGQYQEIRKWYTARGFEEYIIDEYYFFYGEPIPAENAYPFVLVNRGKGQFEELEGVILSDNEEMVEFEFTDEKTNYTLKFDKDTNEITIKEKIAQN